MPSSSNPEAITVKNGDTATFTVIAAGTNLQYQWYQSNSLTYVGTPIDGATSTSYSTGATLAIEMEEG